MDLKPTLRDAVVAGLTLVALMAVAHVPLVGALLKFLMGL
jgi:hypothetical protein